MLKARAVCLLLLVQVGCSSLAIENGQARDLAPPEESETKDPGSGQHRNTTDSPYVWDLAAVDSPAFLADTDVSMVTVFDESGVGIAVAAEVLYRWTILADTVEWTELATSVVATAVAADSPAVLYCTADGDLCTYRKEDSVPRKLVNVDLGSLITIAISSDATEVAILFDDGSAEFHAVNRSREIERQVWGQLPRRHTEGIGFTRDLQTLVVFTRSYSGDDNGQLYFHQYDRDRSLATHTLALGRLHKFTLLIQDDFCWLIEKWAMIYHHPIPDRGEMIVSVALEHAAYEFVDPIRLLESVQQGQSGVGARTWQEYDQPKFGLLSDVGGEGELALVFKQPSRSLVMIYDRGLSTLQDVIVVDSASPMSCLDIRGSLLVSVHSNGEFRIFRRLE